MADKKKFAAFTSPRGIASFPRINGKPDDKFKKEGEWKTGLRLTQEQAKPLMAEMRAEAQKAYDEQKAKFLKQIADDPKSKKKITAAIEEMELAKPSFKEVDEEASDDIVFNFHMPASGERQDKTRWTAQPKVFGPDGKPLGNEVKIGGGSEIQVRYELRPYYNPATKKAGVSLRLVAVMVHKIREWQASAESFGFDMSEAADAGSTDTENPFTSPADADSTDTKEDDF